MKLACSTILVTVVALLALAMGPAPTSAQGCTIDFDGTCPDTTPECNANFSGGVGCVVAGLPFCYDTGSAAYEVTESSPLTIIFDEAVLDLSVFFVHSGGATGTMRFFDAASGGDEVATAINTNGDCGTGMPPTQDVTPTTTIRRIEVTATGSGSVWVDTLALTQTGVPVDQDSWTTVKSRFSR